MNRKARLMTLVSLSALLVLLVCLGLALGFSGRMVKVDPAPIKDPALTPTLISETEIKTELEKAPWQGLQYLKDLNTWRFYGLTGETKQIDLIQPVSLIKVYYLGEKNTLTYTWAATEIRFPGQPAYSLAAGQLQRGQLVAVSLAGNYVDEQGVDWEKCGLEYCHFAQLVDTLIILDDQGTGLSNGFIRYGWEPPSYPYYGFLCWRILPVDQQNAIAAQQVGK
jgi:hypothetical protein